MSIPNIGLAVKPREVAVSLSRLLLVHAVITFAAGVVLIVAPELIPSAVGIGLRPDAYLIAYFLGAAELAIAYLSFFGRTLHEPKALRLITWTLIVFHGSTAALEVVAFTQGVSAVVLSNVAVRALIVAALWYWGLRETSSTSSAA